LQPLCSDHLYFVREAGADHAAGAILFAFLRLEPISPVLADQAFPRRLGPLIAMVLLGALLYDDAYLRLLQQSRRLIISRQLPEYTQKIPVNNEFKEQLNHPESRCRRLKEENDGSNVETNQLEERVSHRTARDFDRFCFMISFIFPFLAYFMLTWQGQQRKARNRVLFRMDNRKHLLTDSWYAFEDDPKFHGGEPSSR